MDTRSGKIEGLPPLELRPLRSLEPVASASGVVRRGDFVYVIGDDLTDLGVFQLSDPGPCELAPALTPNEDGSKPDLEALTVIPPFEDHPFGALLGLGSGSGDGRDRGFVWALDADGSLRDEARQVDFSPLYDLLREQIEALNIEGACVMGERLWLLHRGNAEGAENVIAELELDDVMGSLRGDLRVDRSELAAIRSYDIGDLDGVRLTFSDATPLGRDLLVFTASAEGEGEQGIRGSVVGTIELDGSVHRLRTIDRKYKVEGVHASIDTGVVDFLFVCDQDDPDEPSPLLSAAMPLDATFERAG